jgi:hypothetical protein
LAAWISIFEGVQRRSSETRPAERTRFDQRRLQSAVGWRCSHVVACSATDHEDIEVGHIYFDNVENKEALPAVRFDRTDVFDTDK